MKGYMYILECADGSYYTGSTVAIEKRIAEHNAGDGSKHTRARLPITLVYSEYYDRVEDAFKREKQVQGWSRAKKKALIDGDLNLISELARNYNQYGRPSTGSGTGQESSIEASDTLVPELLEGQESSIEASDTSVPELLEGQEVHS